MSVEPANARLGAEHIRPLRVGRPMGALLLGGAGVAGLVVLAVPALLLGNPPLSPGEAQAILMSGAGDALTRAALLDLRLPRYLLGVLAGLALGLAGVVLQDALRNPIAGPELLGVAPAAAVVMAAVTVFSLPVPFAAYPLAALSGGLMGGAAVLVLARQAPTPARIALIGAAVAALMNALVFAIIALGAQYQASLLFVYLLGSLANHTWRDVALVAPWVAVGMVGALASGRMLNLLQLGDDVAEGLGLPVVAARLWVLVLALILVGAVVAVAGPVPWVALVAPHLARQALRTSDARFVLLIAPVLGAVLLVAADQLARLLFFPLETPVGAWTVLLGGPLALLLVRRLRGGG
ncbi:MAG: ferrichrome ABC transporter permease [Dehalococcoidia bacterium]|nr:MAG: ferrichrome ABC transporter permease [Dehalococcoidia bacterium]